MARQRTEGDAPRISENMQEEMQAMFHAGLGVAAIAQELGIEERFVRTWLLRLGVIDDSEHGDTKATISLRLGQTIVDGIIQDYSNSNMKNLAIKEKYGITTDQLYAVLRANGVATRRSSGITALGRNARIEAALEMYLEDVPLWQIQKETELDSATVNAELHARDMMLRTTRRKLARQGRLTTQMMADERAKIKKNRIDLHEHAADFFRRDDVEDEWGIDD